MNYSLLLRGLWQESFYLKHYKKLSTIARTFMVVAVAPLVLLDAILMALYYCVLFFYQALSMPADNLEAWLNSTKGDLKHATEAVVYFFAMPFIFFCRAFLALTSVFFYFLWFAIVVTTYVITLGGIRWQPFINCARFDGAYDSDTHNCTQVFNALAIANFALFM